VHDLWAGKGARRNRASAASSCVRCRRCGGGAPNITAIPLRKAGKADCRSASSSSRTSSTQDHNLSDGRVTIGWRFLHSSASLQRRRLYISKKNQDTTRMNHDACINEAMNLTERNSKGGVHCVRLLTVS